MSDDLIDRLQNPHFDDLQWPKGLFAECADRIEALETALREIASANDPDDPCTCQCQTECSYGIARLALAGEKKE